MIPNKKNLWTLLFLLTCCVIAFAQASDPDLNNDGIVNILDVSLVGSCFGANLSVNPSCAVADTDGDGDVDMDDLNFVVSAFGQDGFPTEEPTCVAAETCSTGEVGICSAGLTTCPDGPSGAPICQRTSNPVAEVCNDGLDNDCDGEVDDADVCAEPTCTVSEACSTGEPGVCSAGLTACPDGPFGVPVCERINDPVTEICGDGLDNNCDGEVDDADVCTITCTIADLCDTGESGICSAGLTACPDGPFGAPVCDRTDNPVTEVCDDGLDNDCNDIVDDPSLCETPTCTSGLSCATGVPGICASGLTACPDPFGTPVCESISEPGAESCDGLDNDCDGSVDEDFSLGSTCDTGADGICGPGVLACGTGGDTTCIADNQPQPEICNDGIDQDCDGSDCVLLTIDIQQPDSGLVTAADSIDVSGTIGPGVVTVEVSGVSASISEGSFTATVPLRSGPNMLVAIATDANGNTGTDSVQVARDNVSPNVQINSPPDGFQAIVDRVTVTGIVNDIISGGLDAQVSVNGIEAFVQQGTFMVMDVPLVRGPNTIVATAADSVGNTDTTQIQVSFDPPAGAKLEPFSGDGQAGLVGTTLAEPLTVRVVDDSGNALASRVVRFDVLRSDGVLSTAAGRSGRAIEIPTNGAGLASVMLMLGNRSGEGNNQVRASSVGASGEAIFCATAQPALADKILAVMGENQKGLAGSPLPEPFEILVVDGDGNPVAGVPATYSLVAGGGNFDGQSEKTVIVGADGVGRAVLTMGPAEGINNNIVSVTIPDNAGLPATFISTALVAGLPEDTRFAGVVLDNTNTPIPGAIVHIAGSDGDVLTDNQGQFLVTGVPVGATHLEIDPTGSPRPEIFPTLAFEATTVAGRINRLATGPIRIPPLVSDARVVGGATDTTLVMPGVSGLDLTVFAGSANFPDGNTTGILSINQVHLDKIPMPPPSGTIMMPPAWTVQPPGVVFDPPARIRIPNDGLPPGRVIDIFQFDHALNRFVNIGPGTVDEEGLVIVSDPGFGITKSGWGGCGQPQPPPTCASGCGPCKVCVEGICEPKSGSCDDGNSCTTGDQCQGGRCVGTARAGNCDDGNQCTTGDMCVNGSCRGDPTPGASCDDMMFCTENDVCTGTSCQGTKKPDMTGRQDTLSFNLSTIFGGVRGFLTKLGLSEAFNLEIAGTKGEVKVCCEPKETTATNKNASLTGALTVSTPPIPIPGLAVPLPSDLARLGLFGQFGASLSANATGTDDRCVDRLVWTGGGSLTGSASLQGRADLVVIIESNVAATTGLSGGLKVENNAIRFAGGHTGVTLSGTVTFFDRLTRSVSFTVIEPGDFGLSPAFPLLF